METNLRLSEAIRLGSLLRPQAYGTLEAVDGNTCALGAAAMAVGIELDYGSIMYDVAQVWPWVRAGFHICPVRICTSIATRNPATMVVHLNDRHRWTREKIADWVESIEPAGPDQDLITEKTVENREVETCCV